MRYASRRPSIADLLLLVALLALVVGAAVLAQPPTVVLRILSGGADSVAISMACSLLFVLVMWLRRVGAGPASGIDLLAAVGWLVAYAMFQHNQLAYVFPACAALAWFCGRLVWLRNRPNADPPARPLNRRMLLGVFLVLCALHVVQGVIGDRVDVGEVSVRGATALLEGRSPYTDSRVEALLGTTYGPLAYELHVPAVAALGEPAAQRVMASLGHIVLAIAVFLLARSIWGASAGLLGLVAWLAFPAATYTLSVTAHDDWVAALVIFALLSPPAWLAGLLLGLAAAIKLYPALLLPLLLASRVGNRNQLVLLTAFGLSMAATFLPILLLEPGSLPHIFDATVRNQASRVGIHLWNVPPDRWWPPADGWTLPYNLGFTFDPQWPRTQFIAKAAMLLAVLALARGASTADLRSLTMRAGASVLLVLLVLNNLSWNYVSWFTPLVAVLLFASPRMGPVQKSPSLSSNSK